MGVVENAVYFGSALPAYINYDGFIYVPHQLALENVLAV